MWHASARAEPEALAWELALDALDGVGDPELGEWRERGRNSTVHVRRRLADAERRLVGGLDVTDVRGTREERRRIARLGYEAPHLRRALGI